MKRTLFVLVGAVALSIAIYASSSLWAQTSTGTVAAANRQDQGRRAEPDLRH